MTFERPRGLSDDVPIGSEPGSTHWYGELFSPPRARPLIAALHAFDTQLEAALISANHEVAHTRIQWWRGEVDRLLAGRPQHPISGRLLSLRELPEVDLGLLHERLAAADLDLARMTYANRQELEAYCFRARGALQTLIAASLAGSRPLSEREREFARRLGSALRQSEILRTLPTQLLRGHLYAPLDELQSAGIDADRLTPVDTGPHSSFLQAWRERLLHNLGALADVLNPQERAAQRAGLVLAALHRQQLQWMGRQPPSQWQSVGVPPLRSLWMAWRTAVRNR